MKIGVVICGPDVAYGPLALFSGTFEEKVAKAARAGCDGVELMVRDARQLDCAAVRRTLEVNGLVVSQVVTGEVFGADRLCLVTPDAEISRRAEERLGGIIEFAASLPAGLGGPIVNLGRSRGRLDWLEADMDRLAFAAGRLRAVTETGALWGVRIALEPLNRYECDFIQNVDEGLAFLSAVDHSNMGLMLDLFHMNIEEGDIAQALKRAGDRLWHVHIADSNRRYPGSGHIDFAPAFAALREMGYQGFVSGELFPWPDADIAGAKTVEYLRKHLVLAG
jgi:sugar phosphate isomerase/epimerase